MKKGQVYEGIVERVDFPNKGIVKVGEETCIVKNSLPGQKVMLKVNKVRKGKAEARLLEVLEKSPLETGTLCSHFGVCGGCTYLSLLYREQLHIKEEQVKKILDEKLKKQDIPYLWEGIKGSPKIYEYRNKMEFSFGDEEKDGLLSLGMHKRGSFYDVVTVSDCQIIDQDYRIILENVLQYFQQKKVSYYHRLKHIGFLRHLLVRKASKTGEILVALVTTSQFPWENKLEDNFIEKQDLGQEAEQKLKKCEEEKIEEGEIKEEKTKEKEIEEEEIKEGKIEEEKIKKEKTEKEKIEEEKAEEITNLVKEFALMLQKLEKEGKLKGKIAGILHITNDSLADVVKSDKTDILYGKDFFYEELLGLHFKISTFSFFQTNTFSAEVLYQTACEYAQEVGISKKTIFDLYSGTGTIAQIMAAVADKVIGVEIVKEAVEAARKNAKMNGLNNCQFIAGDVLAVMNEITEKPDIIILDPPRDGVHPKALSRIISYGAENIIYISCKPTSLARDLEVFLESGYIVKKAVAIDQFPWTANVETVVLLSQQKIL